jgi:hypothetical protein
VPDIVLPQDFDLNLDPATIFTPDQLAALGFSGADTTPGTDATGPDAVSGATGPDVVPPAPPADLPPADLPPADAPPAPDLPAPDGVDPTLLQFDDGPHPLPFSGGWIL